MAATLASNPAAAQPSGSAAGHRRTALLGGLAWAVLAAAGWWMPKWLTFLLTMAAANGLVSLGIVGDRKSVV